MTILLCVEPKKIYLELNPGISLHCWADMKGTNGHLLENGLNQFYHAFHIDLECPARYACLILALAEDLIL